LRRNDLVSGTAPSSHAQYNELIARISHKAPQASAQEKNDPHSLLSQVLHSPNKTARRNDTTQTRQSIKLGAIMGDMSHLGYKPTSAQYYDYAEALLEDGRVNEALEMITTLEAKGEIHIELYNLLIQQLILKNDHTTAKDLVNRAKANNVAFNVNTYNSLINMYSIHDDLTMMQLTFAELKRHTRPTPTTLTLMMKAFSIRFDLKGIQNLEEEIFALKTTHLSSVLVNCCTVGIDVVY